MITQLVVCYIIFISKKITKQQELIDFTTNLDRDDGPAVFFINEQAKKTVLDFPQGTVKVL